MVMITPYRLLMEGNAIPRGLTRDLVSYWKLDEASGNRADSFGANTLTDNNTVTGNPGPSVLLPLASQFTAANTESLSIATNASVEMGTGVRMTIAAWVYMDANAAQISIAGKWNTTGGQRSYLLDYLNSSDRFRLIVSNDGIANAANVLASTFGSPSLSTWYFVVGWYDGGSLGLSVNAGGANTSAYSSDLFVSTAAFRIGGINAVTNPWDGRIAGVGLWKRVLSPSEIVWLYNYGRGRAWPWR